MCFCSFVAGWYYGMTIIINCTCLGSIYFNYTHWQKSINFFTCTHVESDARLIVTIVSECGTILIYNTSQLIWAAQLSFIPIAICRTNVNGLPGAICTLCDNGKINVSYLGSDPQMFQVPPLNMAKLNFEKTQNELIELEKEIKAGIDFTDVATINATAQRDMNVDFLIDSTLHMSKYPMKHANTTMPPMEDMRMVRATIKLHAQIQLQQIQVQFHCAAPLVASNAIHSIPQMNANQTEHTETDFYMSDCFDVATIAVTAVVSFINRNSLIPRVIEKTQFLPLSMFYKVYTPQKESSIKLTISVNQTTAPNLEQLFTPEFLIDSAHNATGFKSIYSGKIVTIVAAKNSNRYR